MIENIPGKRDREIKMQCIFFDILCSLSQSKESVDLFVYDVSSSLDDIYWLYCWCPDVIVMMLFKYLGQGLYNSVKNFLFCGIVFWESSWTQHRIVVIKKSKNLTDV
jgi:hypothetical protein